MKIGILTDSHSGITKEESEQKDVRVLPMPFYFGEECYFENKNLTRDEFFRRINQGETVSTSQPSPADVCDFFDEALRDYEQVIYIPISSGLSGACQSAMSIANDEKYENKVFVVDNGRVSTPMHRSVLDAIELRDEGYTAAEIKQMLENARADMNIYIAVDTLEHLKRGGRISKTSAMIGSVLNIKPVLQFDVGTLDTYKKCRGFQAAKKAMIEAMKNDLNTKFKKWYDKNEVYLLAASSSGKEETEKWINEIKEAFGGMEVMCDDLSLGVTCHIGPGGLGIGCSCKPERIR